MPAAAITLPRHLGPNADLGDVEVPFLFVFQLCWVVRLAGDERAGGEDGGEGFAGVGAEGGRFGIWDFGFGIFP